MISVFLEKARRGESVYLHEVRNAFVGCGHCIECVVELTTGGQKHYRVALPDGHGEEELTFIKEYFYANIYNLISALGGACMTLYVEPGDEYAMLLCATLDEVFQTQKARSARTGYGKCLNVTDRMNAAMGKAPFRFVVEKTPCPAKIRSEEIAPGALSQFQHAVRRAQSATICGMDIGGTDIKIVGVRDGRIAAFKEYDWNPSVMKDVNSLIQPILLLTRVVRAALSMPDTPRANELRGIMLDKNVSDKSMRAAVEAAEAEFGAPDLLDGIGVCFPDVVVKDKIVGGETLKTRGVREYSPDYETEFSRLTALKQLLLAHCRQGGAVHLSNDGSLAAYTAAVELAHSERADEVCEGVFAHTLGTELGTGWIDETGEIPQIPLEVYNCIIDLGNYPAREYEPLDVRSVNNFNTSLPGTLQKYTSQSGAYRLALQYFQEKAPSRYRELFDNGYLEERNGGVYVAGYPRDMRKPLLEHIMTLASGGEPAAEEVFRRIGEYLAATYLETEHILAPRAGTRVLFGRFVKKQRCFELMQQGAIAVSPVRFVAADDGLACTPLMLDLKADANYTVAQFGQAVGAAYYAASVL